MKKNLSPKTKLIYFLIGLPLLVILLVGWSVFHYFSMEPISPSDFYFKDILGTVYYDSTIGCLDICLFKSYSKLGASKRSFEVLTIESPYKFGERIISSGYAKDKQNVWWRERKIMKADPFTLEAKGVSLGKDKNQYM